MTYRRWDDLVGSGAPVHLLIAEVDPADRLPPSRTHLAAIRELIVGLVLVGDFACREQGDSEVHIAFEKSDDLSRIAGLFGATPAAPPVGFSSSSSFKYGLKSAQAAAAKGEKRPAVEA